MDKKLKRKQKEDTKKLNDSQMDIEIHNKRNVEELEKVPGSLIRKIAGSKRKMREYFVEVEKCYIPPNRDLTATFC